ncbi:unnamed protein product [Adineta ricciae]|uniref:Uncharacterized protein n=1 Tax=Adineta ricciae TaxID=249248 RepID=A0A813YXN8_ADIRI|nr:unnamed protein product [Adineta ricciae]
MLEENIKVITTASKAKVKMSEETNVDQMKIVEKTEAVLICYSTRLSGRVIERALDMIYEESNHMDPQILHWRHSLDKINLSNN